MTLEKFHLAKMNTVKRLEKHEKGSFARGMDKQAHQYKIILLCIKSHKLFAVAFVKILQYVDSLMMKVPHS